MVKKYTLQQRQREKKLENSWSILKWNRNSRKVNYIKPRRNHNAIGRWRPNMANVRSAELWAHEMLFGKVLQKPPTITKLNTPNKCPVKMVVNSLQGSFSGRCRTSAVIWMLKKLHPFKACTIVQFLQIASALHRGMQTPREVQRTHTSCCRYHLSCTWRLN